MPKKKKKEKNAGGKADGGLPPPPKFDDARQSVMEAMLSFKITGREDVITHYSGEAEVCKDRNYQQKDKNYHLKHEQQEHLKTLMQQIQKHEDKVETKRAVEKEEVERAQMEKIELGKHVMEDLADTRENITLTAASLETAHAEFERLQTYKMEIQYQRSELIESMHQRIAQMEEQEEQLKGELSLDLEGAKADIEREQSKMTEKKREEISLKILRAMGADTKAEINDNQWIKKQICLLTETLAKLQHEVDMLEQQNLQLMETVNSYQRMEVEATRKVFATSGRQHQLLGASTSCSSLSGSTTLLPSLPALTDKPRTSTSKDLDMGLMCVEGSKVPMRSLPDSLHLPPLQEQHSPASQQSSSSGWPVTTSMLRTIQL